MKTTIKLGLCSSVTVKPNGEGVQVGIHGIQETVAVIELTQDQAGALIFAIEQAAEAAAIAQDRATA